LSSVELKSEAYLADSRAQQMLKILTMLMDEWSLNYCWTSPALSIRCPSLQEHRH